MNPAQAPAGTSRAFDATAAARLELALLLGGFVPAGELIATIHGDVRVYQLPSRPNTRYYITRQGELRLGTAIAISSFAPMAFKEALLAQVPKQPISSKELDI